MRMRKSGNYYIYPAYFEADRSRQHGRRVPKKLTLSNVDTTLIAKAAQRLGLKYVVNKEARYSPTWWGTPGVVLVTKQEGQSKTQLLKDLAKVMKSIKATTK